MILLLGASGYVGTTFQSYLIHKGVDFKTLSLTNPARPTRAVLREAIKELKPEFLINCAGYTGKPNVDASEQQKLICIEANLTLPGIISEACAEAGIPWGHVSSGCIFTGRREDGTGFDEEDEPNFDFRHNNCSFYSGTKALAEEIIAESGDHYIWRLRIPFNEVDSPRNYLSKIMAYEQLLDVENSISQLDEFVKACWKCWEKRIPYGTYNITNPGVVSTREVAALIQSHGFCPDKEWKYFKDEAEFLEKAAKTPRANCVMDSSKIMNEGIHLTEVHDAIHQALTNWKPR